MLHDVSPGVRRSMLTAAALLAVVVALFAFSASAMAQTAYDSIPNPIPGNVVSQAFQATSTSEFGDHIAFVPGTSQNLKSVTVLMSSRRVRNGKRRNLCHDTRPHILATKLRSAFTM